MQDLQERNRGTQIWRKVLIAVSAVMRGLRNHPPISSRPEFSCFGFAYWRTQDRKIWADGFRSHSPMAETMIKATRGKFMGDEHGDNETNFEEESGRPGNGAESGAPPYAGLRRA